MTSDTNHAPNPLSWNAWVFSLFTLLWWTCFFLYPLWYVPGTTQQRLTVFVVLVVIFFGCMAMLRWLLTLPLGSAGTLTEARTDSRFWLLLLGGCSLIHVPFLGLPIISGLDMIDHAVMPAVVSDHIRDALAARIPGVLIALPVLLLGTIAACVFVWSTLARILDRVFVWMYTYWLLVWGALSGLAAIYAAVLFATSFPDRFGDIDAIFRYPPVWKLLLTPLYLFFGLHEETGRIALIVFTYAGAFYLYGITRMFANQTAARVCAMLYVLLPPVFHYGNTHMIEGITLFFVCATFFHWIRFLEQKHHADLILGAVFATLGCLTKHPVVSVIPAFALMTGVEFLLRSKTRNLWMLVYSAAASLIPAVTMQTYLKLSEFNSLIPSDLFLPTPQRMAVNLSAMPLGITWPLAILILAATLSLFLTRTWRPLWLLGCWVLAHLMLSSMSMVYYNVRQALPYYIALLIPVAIFLERITNGRETVRRVALWGALPLFLGWACLFMDRTQNLHEVGRAIGDRGYINFSTWDDMYIPYHAVVPVLIEHTQPGDVIYAPNQNESVKFYIARHNMNDREYLRDLWGTFDTATLERLVTFCHENNVDWFVLPRAKWLYPRIPDALLERFFTDPPAGFTPVDTIVYGTVEVGIWRVSREELALP